MKKKKVFGYHPLLMTLAAHQMVDRNLDAVGDILFMPDAVTTVGEQF